jgi:hypothetical protein
MNEPNKLECLYYSLFILQKSFVELAESKQMKLLGLYLQHFGIIITYEWT